MDTDGDERLLCTRGILNFPFVGDVRSLNIFARKIFRGIIRIRRALYQLVDLTKGVAHRRATLFSESQLFVVQKLSDARKSCASARDVQHTIGPAV